MKRKRYTPEFKSKIVLEVLKEEKTMSEIASSHGIHVNQIRQWRNVKKNLALRSRAERINMMDWDSAELPIST